MNGAERARTGATAPARIVSDAAQESANPYGSILARAVREADGGLSIEPFRPRKLLGRDPPALWHLHWPESVASGPSPFRSALEVAGFAVAMIVADWRRIPRIWTVHNLVPHERGSRWLAGPLMRWVVSRLDGWISLSEAGARMAIDRHPRLDAIPRLIVPHGHYQDAYPAGPGKRVARASLGLDRDAKVLLFFGAIRHYKNVPGLITAFRALPGPALRLIVAGSPREEETRRAVLSAVAGDERISLRLGEVQADDVPTLLSAADGMVLPAERPLNSGSVILGLSFGVPVLAPRTPVMEELQSRLPPGAVHMFAGAIAPEAVGGFARALPIEPGPIIDRIRALHDTRRIGAATAGFVREVIRRSRERGSGRRDRSQPPGKPSA